MISYERVSEKIMNVLKGFGLQITMYSDDGMETTDPGLARRFFVKEPNIMVTLDESDGEIKMNKNKNLSLGEVREIILQLRLLAEEYMLNFTLRVFGNDITPRQYAGDAEQKRDGQMEGINESGLSRMYGGKKTSYQTLEDVKMVVRHKVAVNEESRGARSRNISAIFLECNGVRQRFPHNNLMGARAMARHMTMGGGFEDTLGEHIIQTTGNMIKLREFVAYARKNKLINESSQEVLDNVNENLQHMRYELTKLSGVKTYESMSSAIQVRGVEELSENNLDELQDMFTVKKFDQGMSDVLGIVGKIVSEKSNYYRRIEEASGSVYFAPEPSASIASVVEYTSKKARLGQKISEMTQRIIENGELVDFLTQISYKLCNEGEINDFEHSVIRNVLGSGRIKQLSENNTEEITECVDYEKFFDKYENIFI